MDYRNSVAAAVSVQRLGGSVSWNPELLENLFRHQTVAVITDVHFSTPNFNVDQCKAIAHIPNQFGLQLHVQSISREAVLEIPNISQIKYLIVKDLLLTDSEIAELQRTRPDITIMVGYPGEDNFREFPATRN